MSLSFLSLLCSTLLTAPNIPVDGGDDTFLYVLNRDLVLYLSVLIPFVSTTVEMQKIFDNAVIHTSKGDIHVKLFSREVPKTIENFCVHSKNGYYNGNIFHRVIKGFMVQTGDPTGTGCGGESIWGDEFCDEFVSTLKHDRPYTVIN